LGRPAQNIPSTIQRLRSNLVLAEDALDGIFVISAHPFGGRSNAPDSVATCDAASLQPANAVRRRVMPPAVAGPTAASPVDGLDRGLHAALVRATAAISPSSRLLAYTD